MAALDVEIAAAMRASHKAAADAALLKASSKLRGVESRHPYVWSRMLAALAPERTSLECPLNGNHWCAQMATRAQR